MPDSYSRFRTRSKELALVGAALVVTLLLCELLLRVTGVSYPVFVRTDSILGASHIPGARGWYTREGRSWVEIDSGGLRGPPVAVRKPANTHRIALLGDSYVEAVQVPFERSVGEVLERRLSAFRGGPVEVLNFGVGGYGTLQELLILQNNVWKYSPDLVVLAITTGNDISDNYRPLKRVEYVPFYVLRDTALVLDTSFRQSKEYLERNTWGSRVLLPLLQHSRLVQLINDTRYTWRVRKRKEGQGGEDGPEAGLNDQVYRVPAVGSGWEMAWNVTEAILRAMRDECRRKHVPFAMVTLSNGIQVHPVPAEKEKERRRLGINDFYYPDRRLAEFGKAQGIPVLNLAPALAKEAEDRHIFFHGFDGHLGKGHWNENGHRVAGELIASWIATDFGDSAKKLSAP